jgi:histone H3/H4
MPRKKSIIPPAAMVELIKKAGAERVSENAAKALAEYLMEIGFEIASESIKLAKHAGRKTVKKEDIELAKTRV